MGLCGSGGWHTGRGRERTCCHSPGAYRTLGLMIDSLGGGAGRKGSKAWDRDTGHAQLQGLVQKAHLNAAWLFCANCTATAPEAHMGHTVLSAHSCCPAGGKRHQLPLQRWVTALHGCHQTQDALALCLQSPPLRGLSYLCAFLSLHCLQAGSPEAPHLTITPPSLCSALFLEGPFLKTQFSLQNPAQALCPLQGLLQSPQSRECAVFSCRLLQPQAAQLLWAPLRSGLTLSPHGVQCKANHPDPDGIHLLNAIRYRAYARKSEGQRMASRDGK